MIARGRSIDWLRKRSRRPNLEPIEDGSDVAMESMEQGSVSRVTDDRMRLAMQTLSSQTQELFRMHFELGQTHPEIAEETGLPLGTVKTKLRRGLIELRSMMRKQIEREEA